MQTSQIKKAVWAMLLAAGTTLSFHPAHAQRGGGHFGGGPWGGGHFGGPGGGWHGGGPGGWGGGPWGWGGGYGWGWGYPYAYGGYGGYGGWGPYWGNSYWNPYWAGWGWGWSMPYAYGGMTYAQSYSGSYPPQYTSAPPPSPVPEGPAVQQGVGQSNYAPPSYYASPNYGQYPATPNEEPPPQTMQGSDGTAMFNCKTGYFYNNLTQNCDKR
ncbi:hypothetical protein [Acetobacter okinawensis]|uniref:hypothetical protein n=1 Tax=Acetobacter okinawensis TaxID=1076594 RepID=UPI00209FAD66|nr:hypothetical protein [Acetobacter okinawensis]MCP1212936.1 hypothetical protein [Acetobacter okinawensis]